MAKLTTQEAAERLGVTQNRVRAMISDGVLKGEKFGPVWMIDAEDVTALKAQNRKPGRPPKSSK